MTSGPITTEYAMLTILTTISEPRVSQLPSIESGKLPKTSHTNNNNNDVSAHFGTDLTFTLSRKQATVTITSDKITTADRIIEVAQSVTIDHILTVTVTTKSRISSTMGINPLLSLDTGPGTLVTSSRHATGPYDQKLAGVPESPVSLVVTPNAAHNEESLQIIQHTTSEPDVPLLSGTRAYSPSEPIVSWHSSPPHPSFSSTAAHSEKCPSSSLAYHNKTRSA